MGQAGRYATDFNYMCSAVDTKRQVVYVLGETPDWQSGACKIVDDVKYPCHKIVTLHVNIFNKVYVDKNNYTITQKQPYTIIFDNKVYKISENYVLVQRYTIFCKLLHFG